MGYFHHALWLYAPAAVHAHHVLLVYTLPLPPCDPDSPRQAQTQTNYCVSKLLSPLRQTFPVISTPFPKEVSVCLLIPVRQQLSTCRVIGQVPMKVTAVRSLHERTGPGFMLPPKQPLHLHSGKMWSRHVRISGIGSCRENVWELEMLEKQVPAPTGSVVGWHGCTSLFIRVASLCVFWQRRIRAVSD